MAKHVGKASPVSVQKSRPGEGYTIDVTATSVVAPNGYQAVTFSTDLSKAKVPDRRYAADVCAISRSQGFVKIMFGQERVDDDGWRTLLVIRMSDMAVERFLANTRTATNPTFDELAAAMNLAPQPLSKAHEPSQPNQAAALVANLGLVAAASGEACIDFYHASAFAVAIVTSQKLSVDPVVRVDLSASLLLGLLNGLRDLNIPTMAVSDIVRSAK